jgi:AcrR family transcriptional regulator
MSAVPKEMSGRAGPRPGGRSARVQAAVHKAVRDLQAAGAQDELTVPNIATRAGVTPSTIYRRWGTLLQLLSDVAVQNLRPEAEPFDTGSFEGDLKLWLEQYLEEMASEPGRAMLRDILGGGMEEHVRQCSFFTSQQIEVMRSRALIRNETPPASDIVLERVIAPVVYRIVFTPAPPTVDYANRLVDELLEKASDREHVVHTA